MKRSLFIADGSGVLCMSGRVTAVDGDVVTVDNPVGRSIKSVRVRFRSDIVEKMRLRQNSRVVMTVKASEELSILEAGGKCETGVQHGVCILYGGRFDLKNGTEVYCGKVTKAPEGTAAMEVCSFREKKLYKFKVKAPVGYDGKDGSRAVFLTRKESRELLAAYMM